ncbi:hypothetical protein MBLNU459_g5994t1 [Dothideomycetes sp. NU459]
MTDDSLLKKVEFLQTQVEKLTAESEIRKLHHKYGYYLDKCLYQEAAALFADHPETSVQFLNGRYLGPAGVRRLYITRFGKIFVGGRNGPVKGFLLDHLMAQDIVDYDATTGRAHMRCRTLMSAGTHESMPSSVRGGMRQWWEGSLYENEYIRDEKTGGWRILKLRYFPFWHGSCEKGWRYTPERFVPFFTDVYGGGEDDSAPDELIEETMLWPDTRVVPFHYPHPVTGKFVNELDLRAPSLGEDPNTAEPALQLAGR